MAGQPNPWRRSAGDVVLSIHLTPRASDDRIGGRVLLPSGPVIKARVRALPEEGKANDALEALVAGWLGIGRRAVQVTGGHASRLKSVTIIAAGDQIQKRLADLLPAE